MNPHSLPGFRGGLATTLALALTTGCPPPPPDAVPPVTTATPSASVAASEGPDRSRLPTPAPASDWSLPQVATWEMPNGMRVWHLEERATPLISLGLVFPNGSASDPVGKAGLTALTADMLDEGAGDKSALAFGEALQRLATDYHAQSDLDGVTLSLDMLADKLDPSLALLADAVRRPQLPKEELERRKGLWVAQALSRESDPNATRDVVMSRVLFGDAYGGAPIYGTKTTLKAIRHADVKAQYQALFKPRGVTVIVVGAVDTATLKQALDKHFGDWQGAPKLPPPRPVAKAPARPTEAIYMIDFPGSTQSSVALGRISSDAHAETYFPELVFNWALGGAFSSRLNLNLREDKGYTYGARASFSRWEKAGSYTLAAQVKRETTRPSVDEMLKELQRISGSAPLTAEEHQQAIDGLMLGFPGRFEGLSSTAGQLAYQARVSRPADWLGAWPTKLRDVSLEAARQAAVAQTLPSAFAIVIAGDRGVIDESFADLGRPIVSCDAEGSCKK
ncbi:MAG: pitrilysin family protein [Polyangiaceae bacterium]